MAGFIFLLFCRIFEEIAHMRLACSLCFAGMLSLLAGAGCSSEPAAQPQAGQVELTPEQQAELEAKIENAAKYRIELQQLQYVDDKCQWLDPTSRVALDITVEEQAAWVLDKASAGALELPEVFNEARAKAETTTCDDEQMKVRFRYTTWQQRITWALRAQAMLDGEGRPAWFAEQSPVLAYRESLDETVAAMKEQFEASISAFQLQFEAEAVQSLSLLCPNAPHQCPLEKAEDETGEPFGKAYAEVWVKSAVAFAQALDKDPVKFPPMPGSEEEEATAP